MTNISQETLKSAQKEAQELIAELEEKGIDVLKFFPGILSFAKLPIDFSDTRPEIAVTNDILDDFVADIERWDPSANNEDLDSDEKISEKITSVDLVDYPELEKLKKQRQSMPRGFENIRISDNFGVIHIIPAENLSPEEKAKKQEKKREEKNLEKRHIFHQAVFGATLLSLEHLGGLALDIWQFLFTNSLNYLTTNFFDKKSKTKIVWPSWWPKWLGGEGKKK